MVFFFKSSLKLTSPLMFLHYLEIHSAIQIGQDLGRSLDQAPAQRLS